jgi:DNA-binding GntR family transcriptional regulator
MEALNQAKSAAEPNKKRRVYEILKSRIVNNEYKPQEYLNEQSLCESLGVSKTPVREALQQLEHNKFVIIVPNKGCFVSGVTIDLIREVFEFREILECSAARIAATRSSRKSFTAILENHESFNPVSEDEIRTSLLSGYQIHSRIIEATENSILTDYYGTILDHILRIRVYFINRFEMKRLKETEEEHKDILRAIIRGDPASAETAMRKHLNNSLENIKQVILENRMV